MMKKKLFLAMMAVVAVFATLSFSACSSSDDDNNNTPSGGNGKAQVNAYVAIAPDQLNLFDVTVTVNNGNPVQLTTSNTTLKEITVSTNGNETKKTCRVYDLSTTTLTSFPGSYTLATESKVKDGIELASQSKSDYALCPVIELVDATGTRRTISSKSYYDNIDWSKVKGTELFLRAKTVSCSFDANGKTIFE